jgi:hypothetical protein
MAFLHRGPSYVPPCQLHLPSAHRSLDQLLVEQMAPLRRQLTRVFTKYPVDLSRRMNFEREVQHLFQQSFSVAVPPVLKQRVIDENQLMHSIRDQLRDDQLVLRRMANESNTYYVGDIDNFHRQSQQHLQTSNYYELIGPIDDSHSKEHHLKDIVQSIDQDLEKLCQKKLIQQEHLTKLKVSQRTNIELPSLYFLPHLHREEPLTVKPRLTSCLRCPVESIARYLHQLLRPLFDTYAQATTLHSGGDFIQKLEHFCIQEDSLLPRTQFATFHLDDVHSRMSHADILTALNRFLVSPMVTGRHQRLTSEAIEELVGLVLRHQVFQYDGKVYRYKKGVSLNLPFARLLCNIFMQTWQTDLVRQMRVDDEFYGRYYDRALFTWNGPEAKLQAIFDALRQQYPDIQVQLTIDRQVSFLGAHVENRKGMLHTHVHHDPYAQPFLLPYAVGHPRLVHRQWFRSTLIRAAHYCSSLEDFNDERIYIESTFLANGYSLAFVEYHLEQFYKQFRSSETYFRLNQWTYPSIRRRSFLCVTHQRQERDREWSRPALQLHYEFDWGSRSDFNLKFNKLWRSLIDEDNTFAQHGLRIKLSSKHCHSSNVLLAHPSY